MATVTYKNQPAIHKTRGAVPEKGNSIPYRVTKLLWPEEVEGTIAQYLYSPSIHLCCGESKLGDFRVDIDPAHEPDLCIDVMDLFEHIEPGSFNTVLVDPPYNGKYQWQHDLLAMLPKIARQRIIFQQWFSPVDRQKRYKKDHSFVLRETYIWPSTAYFGRINGIFICDKDPRWNK